MTSHNLSILSDELNLLRSDELSAELRSYVPFTKKLFVAGLVIPVFPWIYAAIYGLLPRGSGGGGDYDDNDVEMMKPGQDSPAAAAATEQREKEKENRYWAWVCLCALVGELLLAGAVGGLVAYDRGLVGGI